MTEAEYVINGLEEISNLSCEQMSVDDNDVLIRKMACSAIELLKGIPRWISVSEGMPEEHETIFARFKGTEKWNSAMPEKMSDVVTVAVLIDGTRRIMHTRTIDGKWEVENKPIKRVVTHWMPNPALPKDGE